MDSFHGYLKGTLPRMSHAEFVRRIMAVSCLHMDMGWLQTYSVSDLREDFREEAEQLVWRNPSGL